MAERTPSPFAGLDTSLLRSTRPQPAASPAPPATEAAPPPADEAGQPATSRPAAAPAVAAPRRRRSAQPSAQARSRPTTTTTEAGATAPRHRATTADALPPSLGAGVTPAPSADTLETVRRRVRALGKEAATYRFTQDEKRTLAEIVYAYKGQGIRTSENEITRIALNYLIEEYQQNRATSILAQVLALLNR